MQGSAGIEPTSMPIGALPSFANDWKGSVRKKRVAGVLIFLFCCRKNREMNENEVMHASPNQSNLFDASPTERESRKGIFKTLMESTSKTSAKGSSRLQREGGNKE